MQGVERAAVAKEERFLRGDGVDDFLLQPAVAGRAGPQTEIAVRCAAAVAGELPQAALNQVALRLVEHHAAELRDELGDELEILGGHLHGDAP